MTRTDEGQDIWVFDLARPQTPTRLTTDPAAERSPVWTKDGQRLVFHSTRAGAINIFEQAADGTGATERLTQSMNQQIQPTCRWTASYLLPVTPKMGRDLMLLSLDVTHRVQTLLQTAFEERGGRVSPDGHWLVYESNSSGRFEVYVRPFPSASAGPAIQISTAGGTRAVWARAVESCSYCARWPADGGARKRPGRYLERRYPDEAVRQPPFHGCCHGCWRLPPDLRRRTRRPLPDDQGSRRRSVFRVAAHRRRPALVRGTEAPRADQLTDVPIDTDGHHSP